MISALCPSLNIKFLDPVHSAEIDLDLTHGSCLTSSFVLLLNSHLEPGPLPSLSNSMRGILAFSETLREWNRDGVRL